MYKIPNKYSIDLQNRRKIVGFSIPFKGMVFNPTYTTKDQIRSNLINYFMTNKGERIFNPFFGADLRKRLFEIINDSNNQSFKLQIQDDVKLYFPDVKIEDIEIKTNEDRNFFNLIFTYSILRFNISDSIDITIR